MQDAYFSVARRLPPPLGGLLCALPPADAAGVTELRLRSGRAIQLVFRDRACGISPCGSLCSLAELAVVTTAEQVANCFLALCEYSVHSYQQELKQGFFTLAGGHRVGVAGTAVCEGESIVQLKEISSLNLRIARTGLSALDPTLQNLLQGFRGGLILAGEPKSGKTTVLRMISSLLSTQGNQISVVDQRRELWPSGREEAAPPMSCDILSGYPRAEGILQALRCLSPDVILCDEIGSEADARAVECGVNAGVRMIVSIHAQSAEELRRRPQARLLLATGAFEKIVLLEGKKQPGKVAKIYDCTTFL